MCSCGAVMDFVGAFSSFSTDLGAAVSSFYRSSTYVFYCFAEVEGYSKFGAYTGNGNADGIFVYCGFRPAFCIVKRTDSTTQWNIWDDKRSSTSGNNV